MELSQDYDDITKQYIQTIQNHIDQNKISDKIALTLANLYTNNNPQFRIEYNEDDIFNFLINNYYKVPIKIKGTKMIFKKNGHEYDLTDPNLSSFSK